MQSDMAVPGVLLAVLLAVLFTAPAQAAANYSVLAVSKRGLMHLDSNGGLLGWRPETFKRWQSAQVATNPRNGTVCWLGVLGKELNVTLGFALRCAPLANLNDTWDLPLPNLIGMELSQDSLPAFALDWVTENWFLTVREMIHLVRKDGVVHYGVRRSYVCDYSFNRCLQLEEVTPGGFGKYLAAYDISHRLQFHISLDKWEHRLYSMQLDGSDRHELDTWIRDPFALAADPVRRHLYWLDRSTTYGNFTDLNRIDYDGQNVARIKRLYDYEDIASADAVGGIAAVVWNNGTRVSVIDGDTGETKDLLLGAVQGETTPALAQIDDLLNVKIVSDETQMDVENRCSEGGGADCKDICIPTLLNNTAAASCFCADGEQLVDLECRKKHPSYAIVIGAEAMQAIDLETEQVSTIFTSLTNGTKVDVFRTGDAEFLLFWLDAGSLFRGSWSPGGTVSDVQLLLQATDAVRVVDVAVYWSQRLLFWEKRDDSITGTPSRMIVEMSPLDGSYVKTVFVDSWQGQTDRSIHHPNFVLMHSRFVGQRFQWRQRTVDRKLCSKESLGMGDVADVVVDVPLSQRPYLDRVFWIDRATQSIQYVLSPWLQLMWSVTKRSELLTHPSLADAGGLDVMDSRLFWTERSTGRLWTANKETGDGAHALTGVTTGGRSVRLIQPWRWPAMVAICEENNGGCSHFCLRTGILTRGETTAACDCPDNMELGDDEKTCQNAAPSTANGTSITMGCKK